MVKRLRDRPTKDLLVLLVGVTICLAVVLEVATLVALSLLDPETEHESATTLVADTLQLLIALLAGFLAGRRDSPSEVTA